jgi:hypothetical protein
LIIYSLHIRRPHGGFQGAVALSVAPPQTSGAGVIVSVLAMLLPPEPETSAVTFMFVPQQRTRVRAKLPAGRRES